MKDPRNIAKQATRQLYDQFENGGISGDAAGKLLSWFHTQNGEISWADVHRVGHNAACAVVLFHTMALDRPFAGLEELGLTRDEVVNLPMSQTNEEAA